MFYRIDSVAAHLKCPKNATLDGFKAVGMTNTQREKLLMHSSAFTTH